MGVLGPQLESALANHYDVLLRHLDNVKKSRLRRFSSVFQADLRCWVLLAQCGQHRAGVIAARRARAPSTNAGSKPVGDTILSKLLTRPCVRILLTAEI